MKNNNPKNTAIRNQIKKGLDLTFKKLLASKRQSGGILVLSINGKIRKVKAADLLE